MKKGLYTFLFFLATQLHAQINPVILGSSSNLYSTMCPSQNSISASNALNTVIFIHRQDVFVWGGGTTATGILRYDVSTNGGNTFQNDLGTLNPIYTYQSRMPQISLYNTGGNTNPMNANAVVTSSYVNSSPEFTGLHNGLSNIVTSGTPTSTEHYVFAPSGNTYGLGGLCQRGNSNEFYQVSFKHNGSIFFDSVYLFKGVVDTSINDINWNLDRSFYYGYNMDGVTIIGGSYNKYTTQTVSAPNMAFAPNGINGFIVTVGDFIGGQDTSWAPIVSRTTNGGSTWSALSEINLSTSAPWLIDSLISNNTYGPHRLTISPEYDVTVDINGNPHILLVAGQAEDGNYDLDINTWSALVDLSSTNGGVTWQGIPIARIFCHQPDEFGGIFSGTPVKAGNYPQISRDETGNIIFYSWTDSDPDIVGPTTYNVNPNLLTVARNINQTRTCVVNRTEGDLIWDGKIIFPQLAPTVLSSTGEYEMPMVLVELQTASDEEDRCHFYYAGNDVKFTSFNFTLNDAGGSVPQWGTTCPASVLSTENLGESKIQVYPNPSNEYISVKGIPDHALIEMYTIQGQLLLTQKSINENSTLNVSEVPSGVYIIRYTLNNNVESHMVVVNH